MGKYIGLFVALALLGVISYYRVVDAPVSARDAVQAGLEQVKATTNLDPVQESVMRVQLALADYIATNGTPPDALEVLVPKYFDEIPKDPATGATFEYFREGASYRLGAQTQNFQPLAKDNTSAGGKAGEAGASAEVQDFINPNTMVIDDIIYDPNGKRDPFLAFDFAPNSVVDDSVPPLERYDIGQLKVTAILQDANGDMTAIVEDATGRGFPVRKGSKVGNRNGEVVSIEKDKLHVVQSEIDFTGKETSLAVVMKIQQGSAGGDKGKKKR